MLSDFGLLGVFMIFAIIVPASMLLIPLALTLAGVKPQRPDRTKNETYECGMESIGGSWVRFNFRYYFYALLFVIFDVVTVFIYPWAVNIRRVDWFGFFAMLVFVAILFAGLAYAWKKKALEWK
ncbi:MAG: NADH-quinone oxidoreductase subunit A [Chloroflexi bacterium]|nr:NADH-quinone oxidoreductase subunit A [Chloroflexota bacterium]